MDEGGAATQARLGRASKAAAHEARAGTGWLSRVRGWLPEGREISEDLWQSRHRAILLFILAHAIGLPIFGYVRGWSLPYLAIEGGLIAGLGLLAAWPRLSRRYRSVVAALACVTSSAVLVQFWGGYIEGHFHFFVVVALIALYQDWWPFLLAVVYVAVDHGAVGTLQPTWVYNHPAGISNPWLWGLIHAVLVLMQVTVLLVAWKSAENYRSTSDNVLQAAGEGILGLDLDGRVTFANPTAAAMAGMDVHAMVGRPVTAMLNPGSDAAERRLVNLTGGAYGYGLDARVSRADGTDVPVDWVTTPIERNKVVVGSVLVVKDARERKRAEEEHRKRVQQVLELDQLKEQDRFKTLFINTAAHELRTPLTPIKLHLFSLKEGKKGPLNESQLKTVEVFERNIDRLTHLVEDVLNVAKLQAGRLVLERSPTDVGLLLRETAESFQEAARKGGIFLDVRAHPSFVVPLDAKRVSQVLVNLVDNALKFTPRGGRIGLEAEPGEGGVVVRVRDSGTGLRPDQIARLFKPFSQVHDTMQQTRAGTGLGLYISKGIVELHGGHMRAESAGPGQGSTFVAIFPSEAPRVEVPPAAAVPVSASSPASDGLA